MTQEEKAKSNDNIACRKRVLFADLDGTLIDSRGNHYQLKTS